MALGTMRKYDIGRLIAEWEVPHRPSCSNCSNCRVYGPADEPLVRCAAGHNESPNPVQLGRLIRPMRAVGFKSAEKCPDYDDMGEP